MPPRTMSSRNSGHKIAAAEARTETKGARLEGKIDTLAATVVGRIDAMRDDLHDQIEAVREDVGKSDQYNRDTRLALLGTFVAGIIALGALIVGMATYGDALFSRGINVRDVVQSVIKEQQEIQRREQPPPVPIAPAPVQPRN